MTKKIDELVNRFLRWKLPKRFVPTGSYSHLLSSGKSGIRLNDMPPSGLNPFGSFQLKNLFTNSLIVLVITHTPFNLTKAIAIAYLVAACGDSWSFSSVSIEYVEFL